MILLTPAYTLSCKRHINAAPALDQKKNAGASFSLFALVMCLMKLTHRPLAPMRRKSLYADVQKQNEVPLKPYGPGAPLGTDGNNWLLELEFPP
jgi:hypothetical protein